MVSRKNDKVAVLNVPSPSKLPPLASLPTGGDSQFPLLASLIRQGLDKMLLGLRHTCHSF